MDLKSIIDDMINDEMLRTGRMGTESVAIKIELNEEEQKEFFNLNLNDHYYWEREENTFYISYREDL